MNRMVYYNTGLAMNSCVINTDYSRHKGKTFKAGDKMVAKSPSAEHQYVVAVGFCYTKDLVFVLTMCDNIVQEELYRKPKEYEMDRFSKYPDTVILRTYLNSLNVDNKKKKLKGNEPDGRITGLNDRVSKLSDNHIHVDDFVRDFGSSVILHDRVNREFGIMVPGLYIDVNFKGSRNRSGGMECFEGDYFQYQDKLCNNDHPYSCKRMLCGEHMTPPFYIESDPFNFTKFIDHPGWHDDRNPLYVKRVPEKFYKKYDNEPELWDPVSDIVKVERMSGPSTFISEFGYICNMRMYERISCDKYSRWLMILL